MSILDKLTNRVGETITFYSYKGGNGRTMALSNVATLLAQQNPTDKILMIDWDLEAPGLHRFFFQASLFTSFTIEQLQKLEKNVNEGQGLIDLFITLNNMLDGYSKVDDSVVRQILNKVKFDDYIISTSLKNLFILKAGRFDKQYSDKVNTFNWENLYNKSPSLIRLFSETLTKQYKYVLIDSRTGFTDISGICTMLLPQKLVVVFTPNNQSYTGIKDLILKATTYRRKSNDIRPLLAFPLPSRIEFSRDDLRAYWRYGNHEKKITGYQNMFQDIFKDVYGLDECNLTEYFEQVQIQQSPNYAYGEEIAVISEKTKDSFSLSKSYEIFTQWLVDSNPPWESKSEESSNINPSAAIDFENIGLDLQNKGEYEKALSYYNRSLAIYEQLNNKKELAQIHNKIGILLKNMKRYDDALDNHQKALDIHLNIKDRLNIPKDYTNIASIFEKKSEYDQALELYDEAIKINPNNFEAYYNKGKVLGKLKRFEEAIKCHDQAIRIDPDNVDALNEKGNILYNQGKYQEAIEYFNKVLSITPNSSIAQNTKNLAQIQLNKKSTLENRKAIIIGIDEYESDPSIPRLEGAENDAKEIRDRLIQYGGFEISNNHFLIGRNATRRNIITAISEIFRKEDKCDLVIFYFSGHGVPDLPTMDGYIAPYDYYPDDPIISGINMAELKKAIYNTKNIKNIIIILDCSYNAIVTKDTEESKAPPKKMVPPEQEKKRNLFSLTVEKMVESSTHGQGKIVLASSEADAVSKEKNNCIHADNDSPHSHGAFSYYLIEGLEGGAADHDTGIISIESLRKYIEDQMTKEGKQKPIYSIAEASNFDNIKIAISQGTFNAKIKKLINEAEKLATKSDPRTNLVTMFSLQDAAKKVNELISLKEDHPEIPRLKGLIDKSLEMYKQLTINWLDNNVMVATEKINEIRDDFYNVELPDLIYDLSFNKLVTLPDSYIKVLFYITSHVRQNTRFENSDDPKLEVLTNQLRAVFDNEKRTKGI